MIYLYIIMLILDEYVEKANDFVNLLKVLAAGMNIINNIENNKTLDKLNLIIKPILNIFFKPHFDNVSALIAFFLFKIVIFYEESSTSPIPKIFKTIFNSINDIFEKKLEQIDQSEKKKEQKIDEKAKIFTYPKYGKKYESLVKFSELLANKYKEDIYKTHPILLEIMTNELVKLHNVDPNKILELKSGISLFGLYKNVKLFYTLRPLHLRPELMKHVLADKLS